MIPRDRKTWSLGPRIHGPPPANHASCRPLPRTRGPSPRIPAAIGENPRKVGTLPRSRYTNRSPEHANPCNERRMVTIDPNSSWRRDLQTIFNAGTSAGLSDGQLLDRIASRSGTGREGSAEVESAFALLIERHGLMVLRVCRGVLSDPHEADDAFQATFLVLLRQAGSIRKRESVGPWLHGVARRIASRARSAAARRRTHERRWFDRRQDAASRPDENHFDLSATIHAELGRLPERYRAPIVLCDLEERSLDEAARQLGWPLGTVKSRLNRGRERLRDRLVRRGVAPGTAGLVLSGSGLIPPADAAIVLSSALAEATAEMIRSAGAVAGGSSASVLALARAIPRATLMEKLKWAAVVLLLLGSSALGIAYLASGLRIDDPPEEQAEVAEYSRPAKRSRGRDHAQARGEIALCRRIVPRAARHLGPCDRPGRSARRRRHGLCPRLEGPEARCQDRPEPIADDHDDRAGRPIRRPRSAARRPGVRHRQSGAVPARRDRARLWSHLERVQPRPSRRSPALSTGSWS